jgi:hypothetical protein
MEDNLNPNINQPNNNLQGTNQNRTILDDTGNPVVFKHGKITARNFWQDGLSINETRISTLIISFIVTLIFSLYMYIAKGDISTNLMTLLTTLIWAIASVNIADRISGIFNGGTNNYPYSSYTPYSPNIPYYASNPNSTTTTTLPVNQNNGQG